LILVLIYDFIILHFLGGNWNFISIFIVLVLEILIILLIFLLILVRCIFFIYIFVSFFVRTSRPKSSIFFNSLIVRLLTFKIFRFYFTIFHYFLLFHPSLIFNIILFLFIKSFFNIFLYTILILSEIFW
jgi:hypothetical protein